MTTLEGALPKPSRDVLMTELPDGESVLLDLQTEAYFGLNKLGTAVWSALANGTDLELLVAATSEGTGEPAANVRADIQSLLDDLVSRNLVVDA